MKTVFAIATLCLLCACQPHQDAFWPDEQDTSSLDFQLGSAGAPAEPPLEGPVEPLPEAPEAPEAPTQPVPTASTGVVPQGLLGRREGPILPTMEPELVQVAVDLANEELESVGYTQRAEAVTTYQGTVEEISFYAGEPGTLGWTPGRVIFVGTGDLCDSPEGYDGRLLLWVLAHEVLHTVGFQHGEIMKAMTDDLGPMVRDYCFPSIEDTVDDDEALQIEEEPLSDAQPVE